MREVVWTETALDDLAAMWTVADSSERAEITRASKDASILADPENEGESRVGGVRITFYPPLAITFQFDASTDTATVVSVHYFRKRR